MSLLARSQHTRVLFIQCLIPCVIISIRLFGIAETARLLERLSPIHSPTEPHDPTMPKRGLLALKQVVAQSWIKGNCLSRSLALHYLLRYIGVPSTFCIGVRSQPRFRAHAWVEYENKPLNAGAKVRDRYKVVEDYHFDKGVRFT